METNISGISEDFSAGKNEIDRKEDKPVLHGKRIAISVSESEELEHLGLSKQHLKDVSIEIARYLIVNGATMLYGGDLRDGGYTELFSELSYQYRNPGDRERKIINYFSFPHAKQLSIKDIVMLKQRQVEPKILTAPRHLDDPDFDIDHNFSDNIEDKFLYAECYTDMRIQMAFESDARIALGGAQKGFAGYFPGLIEETYHSINAGKPVYLLGGYGGAAKSIIEIVLGNNPHQLTNEYQFDTEYLKAFKKLAAEKGEIELDYDFLIDFFRNQSLESIANRNGLSVEENKILFESTNIHELVFLIMKGLKNI